MNRKRAIIIKSYLLDRETRATKIIKALTKNGYLVTFLGWDRGESIYRSERHEAGEFHREILFRLKAPLGHFILLYLPIWWCFVFFKLIVGKWDIAHAGEFASIPPAVLASKFKRKPVIYEMLDVYEDEIVLPKNIRNICINIDKLFMRLASSVILADEMQVEEVGGIPNSNVITIYDSPPDTFGESDIIDHKNESFTLFFAGLLASTKALNLDKIFTAVEIIEGLQIVIAGHGDLVGEIEARSRKMPDRIHFIGEITHKEVLERSARADLLFVLRDPVVPVNKYICGSKILEAMMCGTAFLANKGTSTAHKVRDENCGVVVDADNIEEITAVLIRLRDDPELCKELGKNARKAYETRYSWEIMEQRLIDLYQNLTGEIRKGEGMSYQVQTN